ncbi:hypothetical protein ANO11243_081150 [Dothideomycetidae sp. 11243]|nr:hypothetical protein ANO11243_081150 [fungal sp. No.11243]
MFRNSPTSGVGISLSGDCGVSTGDCSRHDSSPDEAPEVTFAVASGIQSSHGDESSPPSFSNHSSQTKSSTSVSFAFLSILLTSSPALPTAHRTASPSVRKASANSLGAMEVILRQSDLPRQFLEANVRRSQCVGAEYFACARHRIVLWVIRDL